MCRSLILCALCFLPGFAEAAIDSSPQATSLASAAFEVDTFDAGSLATVLRTIVEVRQVDLQDGGTVQVTDTTERLEAARRVVELLDVAVQENQGAATHGLTLDDTLVLSVRLREATAKQAMSALRKELGIRKVVVASSDPVLVILRDTESQVEAARLLLEHLEEVCSSAGCPSEP